MQTEARPSFAFLVATYNHQEYILEHLESIKYLVRTHGVGIDVDVIISDDFSHDKTRTLIDKWIKINSSLFRYVRIIYNPRNIGTCASVNNMLMHMVAERCKVSAGDDVYSFENIFELTQHGQDVAMVSGRALYLLGDTLSLNHMSNVLATATQVIYQHNNLLHRLKHLSYCNAPNLMYATECLMHPNVRRVLGEFDVVEDWPLQIAIARQFPMRRFKLMNEVFMYYRRTAGSTYIVANQRFVNDKIKVYDNLLNHETCLIERIRLANRKFCFKSQNRWINKFLNLDFYLFAFSFAYRILSIAKNEKMLDMRLLQHQRHYALIKEAAMGVRTQLD